ncbi:MAG TPA: GNAT family protein [Thermotogota bacterium]|nr:GNAT family protein [Thermotogota bacterium]HRW92701.1 GNAT family protein [Thermotogota bacterium]
MVPLKKLRGSNCILTPPHPEDAPTWAQWLNDMEVAVPLGDEAYQSITPANQLEFIEEISAKDLPWFSIRSADGKELLGRCGLFAIDHVDRSAMCGIFVGNKDAWGKGIGFEAMQLLLDYAFHLLNLHSVMLGVFEFNQRALQLYRKLGFQEIGRRRQARIIGQKAYDVVLMDMLDEEFGPSRILSGATGALPTKQGKDVRSLPLFSNGTE